MTPADVTFATQCVRGAHMAVSAIRQWAARQELTSHDEQFLKALDKFADAAKEWARSKAKELATVESDSQQ